MLAVALLDWLYNILGSVMAFFYAVVPSYAFVIIMLTIAVRALLIPLTNKQVKSQRAMQQLQPELKKLQAKHKGDRQKLNEEMMLLYKEHKANPLAGCLPLILQMPLFIVLYRLIRSLSVVPPKHIHMDSALYHALVESGGKLQSLGIDLAKKPQSVLGLMMVAAVVATGYFQQRQMTARLPKDSINPQMQMVSKVFPAFFGVISLSVPAGVVLYFIVSNLWQVGQQAVAFRIRQAAGEVEPPAPSSKSGGKSATGGGPAAPAKGGGPAAPAKGGGPTPKGGGGAKGSGSSKTGGQAAKAGGQAAKNGGSPKGGGSAKAGGSGGSGGQARNAGSKNQGGGGANRAPSGRVTPKGGPNGRITPKGGPSRSPAGPKGGKAGSGSPSPSSDGEVRKSRLSQIMQRATKANPPPPAARPKGLPPTKGSSGGSSRKES